MTSAHVRRRARADAIAVDGAVRTGTHSANAPTSCDGLERNSIVQNGPRDHGGQHLGESATEEGWLWGASIPLGGGLGSLPSCDDGGGSAEQDSRRIPFSGACLRPLTHPRIDVNEATVSGGHARTIWKAFRRCESRIARAESPVCHEELGYASGYASRSTSWTPRTT
jgi:hypothetical protein